jgi:hypothetical protein
MNADTENIQHDDPKKAYNWMAGADRVGVHAGIQVEKYIATQLRRKLRRNLGSEGSVPLRTQWRSQCKAMSGYQLWCLLIKMATTDRDGELCG